MLEVFLFLFVRNSVQLNLRKTNTSVMTSRKFIHIYFDFRLPILTWTDRMGATKGFFFFSVLLVIGKLFQGGATQQCPRGRTEYSVSWMMLQRHVFKTIYVSFGYECLQACHQEITCQSFNYVYSQSVCELNDRTKEARPEDFVPNTERYYISRVRNRGKVIVKTFTCELALENDMTVFLSSPSGFSSRGACWIL